MDTAQQYLAAYPQQSPSSLSRSSHAHLTASMANSSWHQSQTNSAPSSGTSSQMFMNAPRGMVGYTSPQTSPSSPFGDFHAGHHSPSIQTNHASNAFPPDLSPQVEGSSGPARGALTRRRARMAQVNLPDLTRRGNRDTEGHSSSMYLMPPTSMSRSRTPSNFVESNRFQQQSTPLNPMHARNTFPVDSNMSLQGQSFEQWDPNTQSHNHSRSTSSSDLRSASPAVSVASALTSVSSARSAQNSHVFPLLNEPPPLVSETHRLKGRKMRLCNGDRKKMCLEHIANPELKQEQLAQMFSVERSTVSKILKNKEKWIAVPEADINRVAKHRPSKFPNIEKQLIEKLREISKDGSLLSDSLIRAKAREVALEQNVLDEKFKASSGWVDNFKSRAGIRRGVMTKGTEEPGSSNAAPPEYGAAPADIISAPNAMRASRNEPEMDNGIESEDSPDSSSLRLQTSWSHHDIPSHHDLPSTSDPPSILREPKQGPGIPVLTDAENAMNTVLAFVYGQDEDFVTAAERNALQHVKNLLFQTGQGLAYHREY